jgi:hypothetical protein
MRKIPAASCRIDFWLLDWSTNVNPDIVKKLTALGGSVSLLSSDQSIAEGSHRHLYMI